MATAKICDRCGKVYQPQVMTLAEEFFATFAEACIPKTTAQGLQNYLMNELDICDECCSSLAKWFKEGARK